MRFYSYNYLLDQIARFDWWGAAFTIFLTISSKKSPTSISVGDELLFYFLEIISKI